MEAFSKLRIIGQGSYGEVWLVRLKKDKKQYVLKQMDLKSASKRERKAAKLEVKLLASLKHPNIVSYKDSFETEEGYLNIVMGYCEGGDLYSKIKEQKTEPFNENQIAEWFVQICMALQYLHDHNILHRDLKTQNIFLTKSRIIKVGDLGIARVLDGSSDMATTLIGTPYYMSPELFSNKPYNFKSDVWALGCCIYELATLKHAFNGKDMNSLMYRILRGKLPAMPKQYTTELVQLIKAMLHQNPDKRPNISKILRRPYIKMHISLFLESTKTSCQCSYNIHNSVIENNIVAEENRELSNRLILDPIVSSQTAENETVDLPLYNNSFSEQNLTLHTFFENNVNSIKTEMKQDNHFINEDKSAIHRITHNYKTLESFKLQNNSNQNEAMNFFPEKSLILSQNEILFSLKHKNEILQKPCLNLNNDLCEEIILKAELSPTVGKHLSNLKHSSLLPLDNTVLASHDNSWDGRSFLNNASGKKLIKDKLLLKDDDENILHHNSYITCSSLDNVGNTSEIIEINCEVEKVDAFELRNRVVSHLQPSSNMIHFQKVDDDIKNYDIRPSSSGGSTEARLRRRRKKQDLPNLISVDLRLISEVPSYFGQNSKHLLPPLPSSIQNDPLHKQSTISNLTSTPDSLASINCTPVSASLNDILEICRPNSSARARRRAKLQKQEFDYSPQAVEKPFSTRPKQNLLPSLAHHPKLFQQDHVTLQNGDLNIQNMDCLSLELGESSDGKYQNEKQCKARKNEMDKFISLLNSTLHLNENTNEESNSPLSTSDCGSESEIQQDYKINPQFCDGLDNSLISTRLGDRISALKRDCKRGIGEELLKKTFDILSINEDIESKLLLLLGKERFELYAGKIWQLKFLEDSIII